ncbi:hypothetical protein, partial [Vibrio jasicida]|uniref:hypothetical protein n=1 Tax=Vibrio jasicida TaxID=766224 RepID=UPI001CA4F911
MKSEVICQFLSENSSKIIVTLYVFAFFMSYNPWFIWIENIDVAYFALVLLVLFISVINVFYTKVVSRKDY